MIPTSSPTLQGNPSMIHVKTFILLITMGLLATACTTPTVDETVLTPEAAPEVPLSSPDKGETTTLPEPVDSENLPPQNAPTPEPSTLVPASVEPEKQEPVKGPVLPDEELTAVFADISKHVEGFTREQLQAVVGESDLVGGGPMGLKQERWYPYLNRQGADYVFCVGAEGAATHGWRSRAILLERKGEETGTEFHYLNLTPSELKVQINTTEIQIPPMTSHHLTSAPLEDGTMNMKVFEKQKADWKLRSSNTLMMPNPGKVVYLVTKEPRGKLWMRKYAQMKPQE